MSASQKSAVFDGVEVLSADDCLKIAQRKLNSSDLEVDNVTMKTLSDTPVGYLGDHFKLKITTRLNNEKLETETDSESNVMHFFVKTMPRDPMQTKLTEALGAFNKEGDFFSILLLLLRKYVSDVDDKNVVIQTPWTAEFYHANSKLIVLDDLSYKGFRILQNREAMDYEHCAVLLKTLARLHASSIIFEEKEGRRLGTPFRLNEAFPQMFKEALWTKEAGNSGRQICEGGINAISTLIKRIPRLQQQPRLYESAHNALGKLFDDVCEMVKVSTDYRNVVCHGDLWSNNILFKYDATGSIPEDARLVDFQILRYTAPAHDFLCALHFNTTRATRDRYSHDLALVYHTALAAELAKYDLAVEELLPWSQFKSSLGHYRRLGVLTSCLYYPGTLLSPQVATDLFADSEKLSKFMLQDRSDAAVASFDTDTIFKERLTELAEELAECSFEEM